MRDPGHGDSGQGEGLRLVAEIRARPGKEEELGRLLAELVEPSLKEAGCHHYELWQDQEDPHRFTFIETWADHEALETHFESDHVTGLMEKLPGLMEGELRFRQYHFVAGGPADS